MQFTANQIAALNQLFVKFVSGALPGSTITHGSLPFVAGTPGEFASGAQGANADVAYSWGNHAVAGYQTAAASVDFITATMLAGLSFLQAPSSLRQEDVSVDGGGTSTGLAAGIPSPYSTLLVFQGGVLVSPSTYTYDPTTFVFSSLTPGTATIVYFGNPV